MQQASAYSPSHITGFFEILDNSSDQSKKGSLGAGVSLSRGVRTSVSLRRGSRTRVSIRINGQTASRAPVSTYVARKYLALAPEEFSLIIDHNVDVPMGTGFGTSGAGALSLSLALNDALKLDLSDLEASQIAHEAEIANKTGLGTVIAETFGGLELRLKPGAPGVGRIVEIPFNTDEVVLAVGFGPISTTHVLSTPWMRARINGHAHELLWRLMSNPSADRLMRLSREFSDGIGLESSRVKNLLSIFDSLNLPASMLMMGEGVFSILPRNEVENVTTLLNENVPHVPFSVSSSIAPEGARVLDS
jgi:pantoate kinase